MLVVFLDIDLSSGQLGHDMKEIWLPLGTSLENPTTLEMTISCFGSFMGKLVFMGKKRRVLIFKA